MRRKPFVYIAGPYRQPDPVANTAEAVSRGRQVRDELGVCVIIPHLSLFEHFQKDGSDQYWLDTTMDLMRGCDAVYRFSSGFSHGTDAEVAEADRLGIPVFHDLASLAVWVGAWEHMYGVTYTGADQQSADDARGEQDAEWR